MTDFKKRMHNFLDRERQSETGESPLRSRLQRLYDRSAKPKYFAQEEVVRNYQKLDECVRGKWSNTPFGDVFVGLADFPIRSAIGNTKLDNIFRITDNWLSRLGNFDQEKPIDFRQTVFVDTETTGLSGGTGTVAFLVGIGYFSEDTFQVDQYFIDSFAKEEGMLDLIADFLQPYTTVISFNGKTFDLPILENRYVLAGQKTPFARLDHLDLLHPSRQLWKLTLENCRLQTIEKNILHHYREDDVPGEEAPRIYFRYLQAGDPVPLEPVFRHNADDIVSLVAITSALWRQFHAPDEDSEAGLIDHARGRMYSNKGELSLALCAYRRSLSGQLTPNRRQEVLVHMALIHKKLGQLEEMETVLHTALEIRDPFTIVPYEELAKYYEHRKKDFSEAIRIVETALAALAPHRQQDRTSLEYRLNRLQDKLRRSNKTNS